MFIDIQYINLLFLLHSNFLSYQLLESFRIPNCLSRHHCQSKDILLCHVNLVLWKNTLFSYVKWRNFNLIRYAPWTFFLKLRLLTFLRCLFGCLCFRLNIRLNFLLLIIHAFRSKTAKLKLCEAYLLYFTFLEKASLKEILSFWLFDPVHPFWLFSSLFSVSESASSMKH